MPTVDLTHRELQLLRAALRSFSDDFGRDQADLHAEIRAIVAKLPPTEADTAAPTYSDSSRT
jgi:hypothetical protein